MNKSLPWDLEKIELEKKGYKFDENDECVFDPTKLILATPPIIKEETPKVEEVKEFSGYLAETITILEEDDKPIYKKENIKKRKGRGRPKKRG